MSPRQRNRWALMVPMALLLTACASNVPKELGENLPEAPTRGQVRSAPDDYRSQQVRWGGDILSVANLAGSTEVEVYGRPLYKDGEPAPDGGDGIRFLAKISGFLDPAQYKPGKRLTVRGRIAGVETRPVGEFPYIYPVVDAEFYHLWPAYEPPERVWARDPYYYDPWWPWGPWGPYRYWPY